MIRDVHPGSGSHILIFYPSRILGSTKRHRIPDPDPQHWSYRYGIYWLHTTLKRTRSRDRFQNVWQKMKDLGQNNWISDAACLKNFRRLPRFYVKLAFLVVDTKCIFVTITGTRHMWSIPVIRYVPNDKSLLACCWCLTIPGSVELVNEQKKGGVGLATFSILIYLWHFRPRFSQLMAKEKKVGYL